MEEVPCAEGIEELHGARDARKIAFITAFLIYALVRISDRFGVIGIDSLQL